MDRHAPIPRHVAVVMDGNGRWAAGRGMPRFYGHKAGVDALVRAVDLFADRGVEHLTVFAFSSENWKRPSDEVSGLMSLVLVSVAKHLDRLVRQGVRIRIIGDRHNMSEHLRKACVQAETSSAANTRIHLHVAFNYGGRWDVVQACRAAMVSGVRPEDLTEQHLSGLMSLGDVPDPDLLIRTGGEMRVSNFLMWQLAYSELFFTSCLWPDFGAAQIDEALAAFAGRDRRFGAVMPSILGAAASR